MTRQSLIIIRWPIHAYLDPDGIFWCRLPGGVCLSIKDTRRVRLMFTERMGWKRRVQVGPFSVRVLMGVN